jgi:hypothetical protein
MVKDSKRFADIGGWGYAVFNNDAAANFFKPGASTDTRYKEPMRNAASPSTQQRRREITFSPITGRCNVRDFHSSWLQTETCLKG